jgi:hypothetical protein
MPAGRFVMIAALAASLPGAAASLLPAAAPLPGAAASLTGSAVSLPGAAASGAGGAAHAAAQHADSAAYIIRFGSDTLAVERWIRTTDGLEAVSVTRSPTTQVRRYAVRFDGEGRITHVTTEAGTREVEPAGAVPTAAGFYAPQALALAQAARARDTLAVVTMMTPANVQQLRVRRVGPDIFEVVNPSGAVGSRAHLNAAGQLLFLESGGSTTVQRVDWFDIDALASDFAARDARGEGLGPLSTRDTARVRARDATITVDYGRPAARGRSIFGGLVPFGAVWRTGADDATQLVVDRAVRIGGVRLEPGTYSLYTIPARDGWTLGINRGTGMAAAMTPDPAQDAGRVPMSVRALPEHVERFTIRLDPAADGAMLRMQWETTEASVPIVVEG